MRQKKIVVCPAGGLANRMRAIAAGIALGRDTSLPVEIIWARDRGLNAPYALLFCPELLPVPLAEPSAAAYHLRYEPARKRNLYLPRFFGPRFAIAHYDEPGFEERYVGNAALLRSEVEAADGDVYFFSGLDFYPFSDDDYRRLFKPSPAVAGRLTELAEACPGCTIGLHIRRTDNVNAIAASPLALFTGAIEAELATDAAARFFVASDDEATKNELAARFPGKVFFNTAPARRDTPGGIIDAMAELLMLSRMKRIYGSFFSTFSDAAARLGRTPLTICKQ